MQRSNWILVLVGLAVMAVALYVWRSAPGQRAVVGHGVPVVRTYPVPADRGEEIRDALRTVLLVHTNEGRQALGQASLPLPERLVVSAPASMHSSIASAIEALSGGANAAAIPVRAVAVDLWVVGVQPGSGGDDPVLAAAMPALDAARGTFGLGRLRLVDRATAVGFAQAGALNVRTSSLVAEMRLAAVDADTVNAKMQIAIIRHGSSGSTESQFGSQIPLRNGEWQVIGLIRDAGTELANASDVPDLLLLVRQTAVGTPAAAQ